MARKNSTGINYRHSRSCDGNCRNDCNPSATPWEAWVYDAKYLDPETGKRGKKLRQRFDSHAAAKGWRSDATSAVRQQKLRAVDRATSARTLRQEVDDWLTGAASGRIANKRNKPYKPAVVREYERSLRLRILPALGDRRLSEISLGDLMRLLEELRGTCSDGTIRNAFVPLAAIYRRARLQERVTVDPTTDLPLPSSGTRDRAATPGEAAVLLEPLAVREQGIWATAFYAGLRRGELQALRVHGVDLQQGTIRVEHSWDRVAGEIAPKTESGDRIIFLADALRPYLAPLVEGRDGDAFVFGSGLAPFEPRAVDRKAGRAWTAVDKARADEAAEHDDDPSPLSRFTLHEARHSFSTWLDHSGVSEARADRYMGHRKSGAPTRYRHLLPAQLAEDRKAFDTYLAGSVSGKVVSLAAAG